MDREKLLKKLWEEQDKAFELMTEYDSLPHYYGNDVLYQAEAYIVHEIGNTLQITVTELSERLNKTKSAVSQMVKRLMDKGLVEQTRDIENRRIYHLTLTKDGKKVYNDHIEFNVICQKITFDMLSGFTDEELAVHTKVQQMINRAYQGDVDRSREKWAE